MKSAWLWVVLAGGIAGCVSLPTLRPEPKAPPAPVVPVVKSVRPVPPVTAEQITEANAREKANALRKELDREASGEP